MANVYLTEFGSTIADHGRGGSAAQGPVIANQFLASSGSSQQFAALNANTRLVRIHTDGIIAIDLGPNAVASPTGGPGQTMRMAANQTEYFGAQTGIKVAVITST